MKGKIGRLSRLRTGKCANRWKAAAALAFAAALLGTLPGVSSSVNAKEAGITKEEVVYSSLAADGQVKEIYVVNAFGLPEAGEITDYGEYSLLENLTNTDGLLYTGNKVTVKAEAGRFYYQGNLLSRELPWNIQISYTLDGKKITAGELGGAAGEVGIKISTSLNPKAAPIFYENYMLQVTVTLDTSICRNIAAKGATLANAGANKQITFTVMPETEGNLEVSAEADGFSMKGISIAAVPFSMGADMIDLKDIDKLTDGLSELSAGVTELNSGAQKLKSGADALKGGTAELKNGVNTFNTGISRLKDGAMDIGRGASLLRAGSGDFLGGLNEAAAGSEELLGGSGQIEQAMQMLKAGTAQLTSLDLAALQALPGGLDALADGLQELQDGYAQIFAGLDQVIRADAFQGLSEEELLAAGTELAALGATEGTLTAFDKLAKNYQAAMTMVGTYEYVKQNHTLLQENLGTVIQTARGMAASLESIKAADPNSLNDLANGIAALADQYSGFHQGLAQYVSGVKSLAGGYTEIDSGIGALADGAAGLSGGISQTADGAASLQGGVNSLDSGVSELTNGVSQLAGGLRTLNEQTEKMPAEVKKTIDEMTDKYRNADFTPVSFTSPENQNVMSVQFVLLTEGIELPAKETKKQEKAEEDGIWEKFRKLFE